VDAAYMWLFLFQGLESEILRDHLTILAENLNKARAMIYPPARNASKLGELLTSLAEVVDKEHKKLLARKSIIEKRKEEEERKLLERVLCKLIFWHMAYNLMF
jgi:translation initiation factor 3 subunit A